MEKIFYRTEEVAELLYVSKQTLYNQINNNKKSDKKSPLPPYIKIRGRFLFPIDEFNSWLKAQPRN
ncbi:helix-turn-helix transcriptional regulator [Pseudoalteromonas holothuriae]|uniref:helix-turn-helix transcriptional regulator n=1 Tax=Pseudoalteromonas holothuriae TaxID=2963714 RepID=UPI0021BE8865|nr:helix-turn-helix domain-containing protein [Pseudoalteromonas sp. CIP111951]